MSAAWSARAATISSSNAGNVDTGSGREDNGVRTVPRLGGVAHSGEHRVPARARLEQLDHEAERGRGVDPRRAARARVALEREGGAGGNVRVTLGLVVVADQCHVVEAVLATAEDVAEHAGIVVLLADQLDLQITCVGDGGRAVGKLGRLAAVSAVGERD